MIYFYRLDSVSYEFQSETSLIAIWTESSILRSVYATKAQLAELSRGSSYMQEQ